MGPAHDSEVADARGWPGKAWARAIAQLRKRYEALKTRYGPRYTRAMLIAAALAYPLPIPASSLVALALVVLIAEVHRAIARTRFWPGRRAPGGGADYHPLLWGGLRAVATPGKGPAGTS